MVDPFLSFLFYISRTWNPGLQVGERRGVKIRLKVVVLVCFGRSCSPPACKAFVTDTAVNVTFHMNNSPEPFNPLIGPGRLTLITKLWLRGPQEPPTLPWLPSNASWITIDINHNSFEDFRSQSAFFLLFHAMSSLFDSNVFGRSRMYETSITYQISSTELQEVAIALWTPKSTSIYPDGWV
ncbi:hypothetical protein L218DRAFT_948528 [Marasmius fiardii PR-910]|nr:hypothetical protein L218DRAFT_948528 [Marasmius fiardii PR-910]